MPDYIIELPQVRIDNKGLHIVYVEINDKYIEISVVCGINRLILLSLLRSLQNLTFLFSINLFYFLLIRLFCEAYVNTTVYELFNCIQGKFKNFNYYCFVSFDRMFQYSFFQTIAIKCTEFALRYIHELHNIIFLIVSVCKKNY